MVDRQGTAAQGQQCLHTCNMEPTLAAFTDHHLTGPDRCAVQSILQVVITELAQWTDHVLVVRPYVRESPVRVGRA